MQGSDNKMESDELITINKSLNETIQKLQQQLTEERKIQKQGTAKLNSEIKEMKLKYESTNREALTKNKEIDKVKNEAFRIQEEKENELARAREEIQKTLAESKKAREEAKKQIESMATRTAEQIKAKEEAERKFKEETEKKMQDERS
jgi:hypothetical protein